MDRYGFLINAAGILSSIGLLILTVLKRTRPSTIGLMLLTIWSFTGFMIGIIFGMQNFGFLPPF